MPRWMIPPLMVLLLASFGLAAATTATLAAPKAELWARWTPTPSGAAQSIDHAPWSLFLSRRVHDGADGVNRVDYAGTPEADRRILDNYIAMLAAAQPVALSRTEAMAYWINLYNALTVRLVLDHYPVADIRDIDISPGLFANGPWGAELVRVAGVALTLDDIEHRILRPIWRDPRAHYALNCASIGCPELRKEAYLAATLDRQLDEAAAAFVNHPRGVSLQGDTLRVSSIYRWFMSDFGADWAAVIAHLARHAAPELRRGLQGRDRIDGHDYDWRINSVATGG